MDISSPTHDFSFAISLDTASQRPPLALDLTPADDIFFRGHLLPLRLHSNSVGKIGHSFNSYEYNTSRKHGHNSHIGEDHERAKSKSFSLLRLGRRREEAETGEGEGEKHKKKPRFDMGHFLKRYMKIFSKERREDIQLRKQPYSFSGKLSPVKPKGLRGRRAEFSAPASMRTSPGNSGILMGPLHHSNDSSMEELQAAIQAAIAHCKNSIAAPDKHSC